MGNPAWENGHHPDARFNSQTDMAVKCCLGSLSGGPANRLAISGGLLSQVWGCPFSKPMRRRTEVVPTDLWSEPVSDRRQPATTGYTRGTSCFKAAFGGLMTAPIRCPTDDKVTDTRRQGGFA